MPSQRDRRHLFVPGASRKEPFRPPGRNIDPQQLPTPEGGRIHHGGKLKSELEAAISLAESRRESTEITLPGVVPGILLQFESQPGIALDVSSLEHRSKGIEVLSVSSEQAEAGNVERATIFVPAGKVGHFLGRIDQYVEEEIERTPRKPNYQQMLDRVAALRLATLKALWTDDQALYPKAGEATWWEIWLRRKDHEELTRLRQFAALLPDVTVSPKSLSLMDRTVTFIKATPEALATSIDVLNDIAEVRLPKDVITDLLDMNTLEQDEWVRDLLQRTGYAADGSPTVCLLDTGINRGHTLLEAALKGSDCHTCEPTWGSHDHDGHGTLMAGLALYGDLVIPILSGAAVQLRHRLESVKILPPPPGRNEPEHYGLITSDAVNRVEIEAPGTTRVFSLSVAAADTRDRGFPSVWSVAVDALSAGRSLDIEKGELVYIEAGDLQPRLFVVCAGNVEGELVLDHLAKSDTECIHDPGQAWNALTIGAYTEKDRIEQPELNGWQPLAPRGELSPWSATSLLFASQWPIKPELVSEGGNWAFSPAGVIDEGVSDLMLLSTHYEPINAALEGAHGTSAATAQVSRMAAIIAADYPELWVEAIRGLLVHTADWTPRMMQEFKNCHGGLRAQLAVLRRYGYGVPDLQRASRSAADSLTLIAQEIIHPFEDGKLREMHLFELPWPVNELRSLGEAMVKLKVTLSYYIEPRPGHRGWRNRYRYASHGLRFNIKEPTESVDDFRKRVNFLARTEEDGNRGGYRPAASWFLGPEARDRGSLHSDSFSCTAVDLASRGVISVHPVTGWWHNLPLEDRSASGTRYALIVSIETEATEIDLWTPVASLLQVPTQVEIVL